MTFLNPAFCPAWKSPLKMVVWNRPRGIRSQGCFFVSPRWGKSKKRVLNAIGRRSSTRLFALLGKAHSKWWYETDLVEFDPKVVVSFRPDWESRKNAFWTQLDDVRQPGFLPCLEKPTQNGGMRPTSWNSIKRVFFRFAPMGKVEITRFERNWTTFVNPAFCPGWKSPLKMLVWNRPRGIRSQGCFFVSPLWGMSKKRDLNAIGRRSSTRLFALLGKAHSKWWYETDLVEFDPKGVFSFRPDRERRKNAFWTQLDDVWQPGFLPCLEKPTQNGGMKPTSWNSIPRVFFRFAPIGKDEKTRFERNWTTFVNPAFCPAWKIPLKMVVWNRPRGIRSQGCFCVSPRCGKSKKRVLNAIGRRSSTRLFALLGKAHSKWWYETDLVEFDPKGVVSFRPDGESRKNAFWTQLDDVRQPGFLPCLEKPTQNGGMRPTSWNSIPRVFFRFAPKGKVEKTRFERNWTTFVNPTFGPAWKSRLKMVVWNRPRGIRSQGCFFVSPRWEKSKQRVLNAIGRRSSTRLFALLGKAHSKWWYETDLVEFDPKVVVSFRPDGESRKNAFWTQLDDVRQPGFLPCLEKPLQNGGMKPTSWNSIPRVFFRFAPMGKVEKTRFERNWTAFVNPAFCPAWKSPLKMVVWNQPRGIRSQGCFFVSTRWGKSKKRVLNAIGRRSSTRLFALLGKAHSKWWYETDLGEFFPRGVVSFRPDGESQKNASWTQLDDVRQPGFLPCLEKPTQNGGMKPTSWNLIPRVFFRFAPMGNLEKTRFERNWTTFVNPAFCPAWKSPLKMVVWNRPRGIRSQGCFCVSPRWASNCVQNAFFRLSPSGRNAKTPLGSNSTRSVSYHHFEWAFPSRAKSRVHEHRPIAFKTRCFDFSHRGETKKHPWDRIPRGRSHTTTLSGLFQGGQKAGLTNVVQLRSRRVFLTFPIGAKRKNTLGIEFHEVGFIPPFWVGFSKQGKKPGWRTSSNCVQNAFFRLSPSGRNETTTLGSNSTRSVSYHHFEWAFPSRAKSRVDERRPIALKTRFFDFPHRAKRKNTLGIEFHEVGFIPPFWVGFSKQGKKPGWRTLSNCVQNAFFRLSPSGRNEKTPLGSNSTRSVSYHHFEWAFPSRAKSRVDERRPIPFKRRFFEIPHRGEMKKHHWDRIPRGRFHTTILSGLFQAGQKAGLTNVVQLRSKRVFFDFPHRGETKQQPWDRIPRGRFHTTILSGLFQAGQKAGLTSVVQLRWKRVFSTFPIGAKRKNTLGIEFHEVGFIPPFWVGFSKQGKKPGWRTLSNCVQNAFFRLSPSGRNEKTPLGSNSTRSVSYHHFEWAFPSRAKSRVDERRPIPFKTRFFEIPHRGEMKKHHWDRIPRGRFHTTILSGLFQAGQKAGLTNVVQLRSKRVFSTFPIGAKRKNTLGIQFHEVGFIPPFWVGFSKQGKKPGWRTSSNCVQDTFFRLSPSGGNEKTPLGSNSKRSV